MGGLLEKVLMNVIDEGGGGKWGAAWNAEGVLSLAQPNGLGV
jgi:hypothetical protein